MPVETSRSFPKLQLLPAKSLAGLPCPWPSYQELGPALCCPEVGDHIILLSLTRTDGLSLSKMQTSMILKSVHELSVVLRAPKRILIMCNLFSIPQDGGNPLTQQERQVKSELSRLWPSLVWKTDAAIFVDSGNVTLQEPPALVGEICCFDGMLSTLSELMGTGKPPKPCCIGALTPCMTMLSRHRPNYASLEHSVCIAKLSISEQRDATYYAKFTSSALASRILQGVQEQQRCMAPDGSDKTRWSAADFAGTPLEDLNVRGLLCLWKAVRTGDVALTQSMLPTAFVNLTDAGGSTCLHVAVKAGHVEIAKLLLESRASCDILDKASCTPAHHIPLFEGNTALELVKLLAKSHPSHMHFENAAGITPQFRLLFWAATGQQGKPYAQMLDLLQELKLMDSLTAVMRVSSLGLDNLMKANPIAFEDKSVTVQSRVLKIASRLRTVHEIQSVDFLKQRCILYLGFSRFLPWSLQLPALRTLASDLECRIVCLGCEAVRVDLLEDSDKMAFFEDLLQVIDALGLTRFVLLDCTFGAGVPLLWKLKDSLQGAMVVNTSWLFQEHFRSTDTFRKLQKRAATLTELWGTGDVDAVVPLLSDFCLVPSLAKIRGFQPQKIENFYQQYREALSLAPEAFWHMSRVQPMWNIEAFTDLLATLPPWQTSKNIPITIAHGSYAPMAAVQEASFNLQSILQVAKVECIPTSMWFWQIEGAQPVAEVSQFLYELFTCHSQQSLARGG